MSAQRPLPTVIGPTENALRALLTKILSNTRIKTYSAWVVMNAIARVDTAGAPGTWQNTVAEALKVSAADVESCVAELRASGLMGDEGSLTAFGISELATARASVSAATARLVEGIGNDEQQIAAAVLDRVRGRAEEMLRP